MTFGIELCYIVTPLTKQRQIMEKLVHHWKYGYGAKYNPIRGEALKKIRIKSAMNQMLEEIGLNGKPLIIGTSSREREGKMVGYRELHDMIEKEERPYILLFGTGWGLTDETIEMCEKMLMPIKGAGDYNHLSLRVALGIILDRIFGERGGNHERDD